LTAFNGIAAVVDGELAAPKAKVVFFFPVTRRAQALEGRYRKARHGYPAGLFVE
jgi:hypothetical protein